MSQPPSVLGIADSDSYLKWGAATLDRLGADRTGLVLVRGHLTPSAEQQTAALAGTRWAGESVATLPLPSLRGLLRRERPDALLIATTGPVAQVLVRAAATLPYRPALVTGLPGMSIPATERALLYRAGCDVFVVHSRRERKDFAALAGLLGLGPRVSLDRLPFLATSRPALDDVPLARVVFAGQAKFPAEAAQREAIVRSLGRLAAGRPDIDVVIKLRACAGEAQTHREALGYDELWARLRGEPGVGRVRLVSGALADVLVPGTGLVTVSSTAVLEALALGLPALVLSDFGVGDENLTGVYADSGLLGTLSDLESGQMRQVDSAWTAANYLHPDPDELPGVLANLVNGGTPLPAIQPGPPIGGRVRLLQDTVRATLPSAAANAVVTAARWTRSVRGSAHALHRTRHAG